MVSPRPHGEREPQQNLHPEGVGETLENPTRTVLLGRAWALDRMRHREFYKSASFVLKDYQVEEASLARDIRDLGVEGPSLLGYEDADNLLRLWAPGVVAALSVST